RDTSNLQHVVTLTPTLLVDNEVASADQSGAPAGLLTITQIDGKAVGTGDPAALLGRGGIVHISGQAQVSQAKTVSFQNSTIKGVVDGPGGMPGVPEAGWRLGMVPGRNGAPIRPGT